MEPTGRTFTALDEGRVRRWVVCDPLPNDIKTVCMKNRSAIIVCRTVLRVLLPLASALGRMFPSGGP